MILVTGANGHLGNNLIYAIITFFLLWNANTSTWSVDNKIGRRYE